MPNTERAGLPYFWSTGIAKALVGEKPCLLEPWVKGHFQLEKAPRSAAMVKWNLDHTAMLTAEVDRLRAEGWRVSVEKFFRLTGKVAILGGKPDVICQGLDGKRPKIVDTKSGSPKDSDIAQVIIYCIAIPLAWDAPGLTFEGEVVYADHRVLIKAHEVGPMRERLFALLKKLGTMAQPAPSPSEAACRFCEVPDSLCGSRWRDGSVEQTTDAF